MRRKAAARRGPQRTPAPVSIPTTNRLTGPPETPAGPPAGRGLGKAGAKRLGRLLKRAIGGPEEATGRERAALPKTPVRLLKHQIQSDAEDVAETSSSSSVHVSQLILGVVSECKHRGGISMAELKQTLAAAGYDVSKNNRRLNMETRRLVNNETLVRTTRNTTFRLNNKLKNSSRVTTLTDTKRMRTRMEDLRAAKEKLKQSPAVRRSPRRRTTTKLKDETTRAAAGSHKPARKTHKQPAAKPQRRKRRAARNRRTQRNKTAKKTRRTRTRKQVRRKQRARRRRNIKRRGRNLKRRAQYCY